MLPKEHGAYGQLLFPLLTALAIGRPTASALAIVLAAVFVFLGHEPLIVVLGQRGPRAARERRGQATRWLVGSVVGAFASGGVALAALDPSLRATLILPVVLGAVVLVFILAGREHIVAGEVASAVALASLAYPVSRASGATVLSARTCAMVFAVGFAVVTVCVHAVIANTRHPPARTARAGGLAIATVGVSVLVLLVSRHLAGAVAPWAALPLAGGGGTLVIAPPSARRLRIVGWTLVATTTVTSLVVTVALR